MERTDYVERDNHQGRLEVDSHKTDDMHDLQIPSSETQFCSFIALSNVFRRLVSNFAYIVSQLTSGQHKTEEKEIE